MEPKIVALSHSLSVENENKGRGFKPRFHSIERNRKIVTSIHSFTAENKTKDRDFKP